MAPNVEGEHGRGKKVTLTVEEGPYGRFADAGPRRGRRLITLTAAAVGAYYLFRAVKERRGSLGKGAIHVSKSITIERPVGEIYRFWSNLENLPRVMGHVESVRELPNGRSRWKAKGPVGSTIEWDAETLIDRENEIISWRSVEGSDVPNEGTVRFRPLDDGRHTEVKVSFTYHPPAGAIGAAIARLFGEEPSQQVADDLRKLKQELETGGVMTSDYARPASR